MIERLAPAKVNLALHVIGQRPDGYHLLDSLVVFAEIGDVIRVSDAEALRLEVTGPLAADVPPDGNNLVLKAAQFLDPVRGAHIELEKYLPAAAGIGGGSSDAAAALLALSELWGMIMPRQTVSLGADVPMCLTPVAQRISGIGEGSLPVEGLPVLPAILVNPGVAVPTQKVFRALETRDNRPMSETWPEMGSVADVAAFLATTRNDLEAPARAIAPEIDEVLAALSDAAFARMSGSGATCFGLYQSRDAAEAAASRIAAAHPGWWVRATMLNPASV